MRTVLHWFRRDLRVSDNTALHQAYSEGDRLSLLYVWDDAWLAAPETGAPQVEFLRQSLASLQDNLAALGHTLAIRRGAPHVVVPQAAREAGAVAVYANRDYEPSGGVRDARVAEALRQAGAEFVLCKDSVVWEGRELLSGAGTPYTVFTPYSKAWLTRPIPPPAPKLGPPRNPAPALSSQSPPADAAALGHRPFPGIPPAGEHAALTALRTFLEAGVHRYATDRDFPALEGAVSGLSPHFRAGTLGIRTALARLRAAPARGAESDRGRRSWENELIWREFYAQILANFPHVAERCLKPEYDAIEWPGGDDRFQAWTAGRTGYPMVDAAMRCLDATGTMHNRLRMITAMFLVKDLLVSWRRGERWFMTRLVDADLAANNGGWQWSAGVGADAAPYFRIFNPVTQGKKFDPDAAFIRRWIPELRDAPSYMAHEPWRNELWRAECGYPERIVDHGRQRLECLALFQTARARAGLAPPAEAAANAGQEDGAGG